MNAENRQARYERGLETLDAIGGRAISDMLDDLADVAPEFRQQVVGWGFGEIYARDALTPRDRQLLTLAVLTTLGGSERQLALHIELALSVGLTQDEIVEALLHSAIYCGFPRALNAVRVARDVFA